MKQLLLILLCYPVLNGFAQSNFSVGLATSLDRTAADVDLISGSKQAGWGYSAGVRLRYGFTQGFSMQSGLSLVSASYSLEGDEVYFGTPCTAPMPPFAVRYHEQIDMKTFQMPFLFSYYFGNRLKFGFTAGTALNYFYKITTDRTLYYEDANPSKTQDSYKPSQHNLHVSAIAGVGCEYAFKKIVMRIEPTAQYAFMNHISLPAYWSLGLGLSGYYRF